MPESITDISQEINNYIIEDSISYIEVLDNTNNINIEITPSIISNIIEVNQIDSVLEVNIQNTISENIISITPDLSPSQLLITDIGVQGLKGAKGDSIQYSWSDTKLGIKQETETEFIYVELKGAKGDSLKYEELTPTQKQELIGDVGSTSTNYTNIFYASLL